MQTQNVGITDHMCVQLTDTGVVDAHQEPGINEPVIDQNKVGSGRISGIVCRICINCVASDTHMTLKYIEQGFDGLGISSTCSKGHATPEPRNRITATHDCVVIKAIKLVKQVYI